MLNQKIAQRSRKSLKDSTVSLQFNCRFKCTKWSIRMIDKPSMLERGENSKSQLLPNFIQVLWFSSIFCSCVISHCLGARTNNPHMFHFKLFALFWYCNTSNGAQRTKRGGGHPGEWYSKTLCSLRKRSKHKFCVALLS